MTEDPTTERWLRGLLRDSGETTTGEGGGHVGEEELAAYLDRRLGGTERRRLEGHLASCIPCRELASEAALALALDTPGANRWAPSPRRRWLAAAASVAVVLVAGWWIASQRSGRPAAGLAAVGVTAEELAAAGADVAAHAAAALAGKLEGIPALTAIGPGPEPSALRASDVGEGPQCLEPRWSAVRDRRPSLAWRPPADASAVEGYEILVVDRRERVVGRWRVRASAGAGATLTEWAAPPLAAGELYAWKISAEGDGSWTTSSFAPFMVLDSDGISRLGAELGRAGSDPFLRASVLAAFGLFGEALDELVRLADRGEVDDRPLRETARALLGLQGLAPPLLEQELERRLGAARRREEG